MSFQRIVNKEEIIKKTVDKRYKQAIKKWGEPVQVNMIIEECGELCEACGKLVKLIMKLNRVKNQKHLNMCKILIEEEIADVEIMLAQAHYIFDNEMINKIKKEKIERLERLLNDKN